MFKDKLGWFCVGLILVLFVETALLARAWQELNWERANSQILREHDTLSSDIAYIKRSQEMDSYRIYDIRHMLEEQTIPR